MQPDIKRCFRGSGRAFQLPFRAEGLSRFDQFAGEAKKAVGTLRAHAAGQAEGGHEANALRKLGTRLPRTARATRNPEDEPDQALGVGKAGT